MREMNQVKKMKYSYVMDGSIHLEKLPSIAHTLARHLVQEKLWPPQRYRLWQEKAPRH